MELKKRPMFIVITGIIIAVARYLFRYIDDSSKELAILIIMASVNFVALAIVLFFIDSEAQNICKNKINNSGIDTKNKKTEIKEIKCYIYCPYDFISNKRDFLHGKIQND